MLQRTLTLKTAFAEAARDLLATFRCARFRPVVYPPSCPPSRSQAKITLLKVYFALLLFPPGKLFLSFYRMDLEICGTLRDQSLVFPSL